MLKILLYLNFKSHFKYLEFCLLNVTYGHNTLRNNQQA